VETAKFRIDDFELYRLARAFRVKVYQLIRQLSAEEKYALAPQMRRAAVSITNNIAEGHGRWHYKENMNFCRISRGSLKEIIDDLNVCEDEKYGEQTMVSQLKQEAYALIPRINSYILYLKKSQQGDLGQ
jgi:four helix bundle protein